MMAQLLAHLWGDYILQSHWMAENKRESTVAATLHALLYSLCFIPLVMTEWHPHPGYIGLVIFGTHYLIDRYGLARYVIWVKNFLAPKRSRLIFLGFGREFVGEHRNAPWEWCKETGFEKYAPPWLAFWLLVIVDNSLHLTCNYLALRWL
jgi:hypothetical protein